MPLGVLLTLLLDKTRLFLALFWIAALFAAYATVTNIVFGSRGYLPFADPNNLVTLLSAAWIAWTYRGLSQALAPALLAGVTFIFVSALLATDSRFAYVVIALMLAGVWIARWLAAPSMRSKGPLGVTAGLLLAIGVQFVLEAGTTLAESGLVQEGVVGTAEQHRWLMLEAALRLILEQGGLTGSGVYTFSLLYPAVRDPLEQTTMGLYVHNDFLQLLLEGGVFLAVPLVVLLGWLCVQVWGMLRRGQLHGERFGYLAAAGVILAHGLVNFSLYILPLGMMLAVLLGCAITATKKPQAVDPGRAVKCGWYGAVLVALYVTILLAVDSMTYAVFSQQRGMPGVSWFTHTEGGQKEWAELAVALNPDRGVPVLALAQIKAAQTQVYSAEEVDAQFQKALEADPWNPSAYMTYAQFLLNREEPDVETAKAMLGKGLALAPQDMRIARLLLLLQLGHAQTAEQSAAIVTARRTLAWCPRGVRVDREAVDAFAGLVSRANRQWQSTEVEAALDACRNEYTQARVTRRDPGPVLRWLRGNRFD